MKVSTLGLDLAKNVFQVHVVDDEGNVTVRRQLRRQQMFSFFAELPPCLIGLEACGTSHYWARELAASGHDVRIIPPSYVKPYVRRGKNDAADAEAICEAVGRPNMRFVPVKSEDQQAALMQHKGPRTSDPPAKHARQCTAFPHGRNGADCRPGPGAPGPDC